MAFACKPIELGAGTTPAHPCTRVGVDPFSVEICSVWDFERVRNVAVVENNALVVLLNRWKDLVNAKKATWTLPAKAAWDVQEHAWEVFERLPPDYFSAWNQLTDLTLAYPAQVTLEMAQTAEQLHGAWCTMSGELEKLGETLPAQPPAPKEPLGIGETATQFASELASTAAWFVVGGLIIVGGVYVAQRVRR